MAGRAFELQKLSLTWVPFGSLFRRAADPSEWELSNNTQDSSWRHLPLRLSPDLAQKPICEP